MEIEVEYDEHHMNCFHTDLQPNPDPPTIICIDGKEYEGHISFQQDGDDYKIIIKLEH